MMQTRRSFTYSLLGASLTSVAAWGQDDYPNRTVKLINPLAPGGTTDIAGRTLATVLQERLKQPFVVENKPGAAGAIGNAYVANAAADGYTLLVTQTAVMLIPAADKVLARKPAYEMKDLAPLARLTADPVIVAVKADSPFRTAQDLIAAVRKNPNGYTYSSSGVYGALHVPMEMFLRGLSLQMLHVPTTGGGPAVVALLGGQVDVGLMAVAQADQNVRAGSFRALFAIGNVRSPLFPDLPTASDLGHAVEYALWTGVFAPAGTPPPVLSKLAIAIAEAVRSATFADAMQKMSAPIEYLGPSAFADYLSKQETELAAGIAAISRSRNNGGHAYRP
jgi:tripartite-type tricarboxylate transporter receptor subunit TctC